MRGRLSRDTLPQSTNLSMEQNMAWAEDYMAHLIGMCAVTRKTLETTPDVDHETGHQMYLEWSGYVRNLIDFVQAPENHADIDRAFPPHLDQPSI